MINIVYGILGVLLGFILLIFLIYLLIRIILNKYGFANYSIQKLLSTIKEAREKEKTRKKQVSSLTAVLLPTILNDFKDFNEREFYNKTEEYIRCILTSIETQNINLLKSDDYDLIRKKIDFQIKDLKDIDISYRYDDIIFHKHAIKSYQKSKGMIKLEISTTLEYYYEKRKKDKILINDKVKKQTRYTTTYVYIYDTKKAGFEIQVLGLNCPNCGSPISSLEKTDCPYCKSGLNITVASLLKCWKIIDIKEDY